MQQSEILAAVQGDSAEYAFATLEAGPVRLWVFADALRVGGVRVAVSDATAREVARLLGCRLTTPKIEDLIYQAAKHKAIPIPFGEPRAAWATVKWHSAAIDAQLPSDRAPEAICATVGKSWCELATIKAGRACNYGWHGGPYAKAGAVTPGLKVVQGVGQAHNSAHWDYSQTLRLVSAVCEVEGVQRDLDTVLRDPDLGPLLAHDAPWATVPSGFPAVNLSESLGVRCLKLGRYEATHNPPSAGQVAKYMAICERNGKRLGLVRGNHCAAFVSWTALQCVASGELIPHKPRASAKELMRDAIEAGAWHPIAEVLAGKWQPGEGDVAIYDRFDPSNPRSQPWHGHADRVTDAGAEDFGNLGANEVPNPTGRGGFREQRTRYDHPKLLGFIEYPRREVPAPARVPGELTDRDRQHAESVIALSLEQLEAEYWDRWRASRDREVQS